MGWICEYCSSANEETQTECFVCGESRSEEEIRESKRILREEQLKKISETTYKWLIIALRILFIASTLTFFVTALIIVIMQLTKGDISEIFDALKFVCKNAFKRLKTALYYNPKSIYKFTIGVVFKDVWDNIKYICKAIPFKDLWSNLKFIFKMISLSFKDLYETFYPYFKGEIEEKFRWFDKSLKVLADKLIAGCKWIVSFFTSVFKNAKSNFKGLISVAKKIFKIIGKKFS